MISASVGVNSSLLLEPAQSLTFALDAAAAASTRACLTLTNISTRKHVVFKVRTTNVDMFMVKPAHGVIEPSGDVPVVITLLAPAATKLLRMTPADRNALIERFLIQSIDRSDDMRGFSLEDLTAFWKRIPKELIINKKLTCRFIEACDGDPPLHLSIHKIRLKSDEPIVEEEAPHLVHLVPQFLPPRSPTVGGNRPLPPPPPVQDARKISESYAHLQRTPPPVMNVPSSPVPSLRPKASLALSSSSSISSNGGGSDHLATGVSKSVSIDSYVTNTAALVNFDEHIQSEDTLDYKLHPSESLTFPVHHTYPNDSAHGIVEGKSYFFITNKARFSGLAFKIKTSNHSGYFVKPARGLIEPKSALRIDVFVNAPDASRFNAHDRELKDRFLVELLFINAVAHGELAPLKEDKKRQGLQRLWGESKPVDRRQAVLTCQILEEDAPIDPSRQTAEQARALLQKSQAATTLSHSQGPLPRETSGETANAWVHCPQSPQIVDPQAVRQQDPGSHQYCQQQPHQPRSPVMGVEKQPPLEYEYYQQQPRSPVKKQQHPRSPVVHQQHPRSPAMHQQQRQPPSPAMQQQQRSPVRHHQSQSPRMQQQPRSPAMHVQPRSPVHQQQYHQPQQQQPYYYDQRTVAPPRQQQRSPYEDDSDNETFYA